MRFLSRWSSKLAAIVLTLVVVAVVGLTVVIPLFDYVRGLDRRIDENARISARLARGPAYQATLASRYDTLRQRVERHGAFVAADSEAIAAAKLLEIVQQVIDEAGAEGRNTEILPVTEESPRRTRVRASFQSSFGTALDVLALAEDHRPWLLLDRLHVRSDPSARGEAGEVLVEMVVSAERFPD